MSYILLGMGINEQSGINKKLEISWRSQCLTGHIVILYPFTT